MRKKLKTFLCVTVVGLSMMLAGCGEQGTQFFNPYDLLVAVNSFDKTPLMQKLLQSIPGLNSVFTALESSKTSQ